MSEWAAEQARSVGLLAAVARDIGGWTGRQTESIVNT